MKLRIFTLICVASFIGTVADADDRSRWLSGAVDAKGVYHHGSEYSGRAPWISDAIYQVRLDYPLSERALHHTGSGLLRLTLNLKTGTVTNVTVVKPSGFPVLDSSISDTFRRWRWKPGKWKQIDQPFTFTLTAR